MKKSKVLVAFGTLVLAVTAVFATKANKKFASVATAYLQGTSWYVYCPSTPSLLTTKQPLNGVQLGVKIYTVSGTNISGELFNAGLGNAAVYYK
jgi:uncharacterized membrane protein YadS